MLEWREIRDFPHHIVSEYGHIQNLNTRRVLKTRRNHQGVVMVGMMQNGVQRIRSVARIVAREFVRQDPPHFDTIIHLNGDHEDCRAFNLMWRTRPFALLYHKMFDDYPIRESVYIPATGERFYSIREACTKYGMVESMAWRAMLNKEPVFPHGWMLERVSE